MGKGILQDWVTDLGLRHQGVLVAGIRGCDTVPRHDDSKLLARSLRAEILNAHCGDAARAQTFIEVVDLETLKQRMANVIKSHDHLPHHYIMHLVHAAEILGYYMPEKLNQRRAAWLWFYQRMSNKLHMTAETKGELDARLNADESAFAAAQ